MTQETLEQVKLRIHQRASFVLNITADWCPDCTVEQVKNLDEFECKLTELGLELVNLVVQKEKRVFLSEEHANLVESLGGHGYPRTILYRSGNPVSTDNVETLSSEALTELANEFSKLM